MQNVYVAVEQIYGRVCTVVTGTRPQCIDYAMKLATENLADPNREELEETGTLAGDPQANDYRVSVVPCHAL